MLLKKGCVLLIWVYFALPTVEVPAAQDIGSRHIFDLDLTMVHPWHRETTASLILRKAVKRQFMKQHFLVGLPDRDGIRVPHSDHVHLYFQNEDLFKTRANVTGTLKHVKSSVARSVGIVLRWSSGYGGCSSFSPPTEAFCDLLLKP